LIKDTKPTCELNIQYGNDYFTPYKALPFMQTLYGDCLSDLVRVLTWCTPPFNYFVFSFFITFQKMFTCLSLVILWNNYSKFAE